MRDFQPAPAAWKPRIDALVASGQSEQAIGLLVTWTQQHSLTPWVMEQLGRLRLANGEQVAAGCGFFWAGVRDGEGVAPAIAAFLRDKHDRPRQLVRSLSKRCRVPLERMPQIVRVELADLGVTNAVIERAGSEGGRWLQNAFLFAMFVVLAVAVWGWLVG